MLCTNTGSGYVSVDIPALLYILFIFFIFFGTQVFIMFQLCNLLSYVILMLLIHMQHYMDSEIRAIMAQYMPLDNQGEVPNHNIHGNV